MPHQLRETEVDLSHLFLDPNNPRYADLGDVKGYISESRIHEEAVQARAQLRIEAGPYDLQQLQDSIKNIGFQPMDRLVVVDLPQSGHYMVVEGNRRLAALKRLAADDASGDITLEDDVKKSIGKVPVLVIDDSNKEARDYFARVLQGVRHVASVKPWGPYQQAQLIRRMLDQGQQISDIKEVLGLSTPRINSLRRVYNALEQMRNDSEYESEAKPMLFSHFEEAFKKPEIRTWLGWDEKLQLCLHDEHRQMFYAWCVEIEVDGRKVRKIEDAKDIRFLSRVLDDEVQKDNFYNMPYFTLADANSKVIGNVPEIDWRSILKHNLNVLNSVGALDLSHATSDDVSLLEKVKDACSSLMNIAEKIKH